MRIASFLVRLVAVLGIAGATALPAAARDDARDRELAKLEKKYEKELKRCREGERRQCDRAKITQADIEELKRVIALEKPA